MPALDILARLASALAPIAPPSPATSSIVRDAAVAVIFRVAAGDSLQLLMIERASYEGDPWSGHVAFPGGRREPLDAALLDTALRETREELGIDLALDGRVLGALERLNPVSPSLPPLSIAPFVMLLEREAPLVLSDEVAEAFWVPLVVLRSVDAWGTGTVHVRGADRQVSVFRHGPHMVWGLTERVLRQFLEYVGAAPHGESFGDDASRA